jgi:hypothetical protein
LRAAVEVRIPLVRKYSQQELLELIRVWRKEVSDITPEPPIKVELAKAA